jgi:hypothetical protein
VSRTPVEPKEGQDRPGADCELERLIAGFARVSRTLVAVAVGPDRIVIDSNLGFAEAVGLEVDELLGRSANDFIPRGGWEHLEELLARDPGHQPALISLLDRKGHPFTLHATAAPTSGDGFALVGEVPAGEARSLSEHLQRLNNELSTLAREHARQERKYRVLSEKLQATLDDLERSYWHLKKIQEAVPICMGCSRLKGDGSNWQTLTDYLKGNRIFLSHGYCPNCAESILDDQAAG